ncbi:GTPase IMAP family member 9-like [Leuresthes tenuis]|uniref:GTPase IMAP family member 9-like n=1 Tax=Leuresthes tenuis TaxID=355514 RepID=UPI003B50091D
MWCADLRVVLLGKTGAGKSSFAEAIFEEKVFEMNDSANSGTRECQSATREVNGRNITVIDTPGFFDNRKNVDNLKAEIAKCITECSPGPHAFLIFLKVEKFTEHEKQIISKIKETFSEEALKYAVVVFTHGDQLRDGMTIGEFVSGNEDLQDLLGKCGGRCHVVDNKYWKNNQQDEYRNNQIQVGNLLNTITEMVNNRGFYTNEMLQTVNGLIQEEERRIQSSSGYMSQEDRKSQAKKTVFNSLKIGTTGTLLGALFVHPNMAEEPQFWCSVCLDLLKEPVTVQCGHSYCRICIEGCWDLEERKGEYSCPQCSTAVLPLGKNTMLAEGQMV